MKDPRALRFLVSLIILLLETNLAKSADSDYLPNILFIVLDDVGRGDLGYHGSRIRTPTMDKYGYFSCESLR